MDSPPITSPNGRVFVLEVDDPLLGAEAVFSVPDRRVWRILSLSYVLVTDATAVNRLTRIRFLANSKDFAGLVSGVNIPASSSFRVYGGGFSIPAVLPGNLDYLALSDAKYIPGTEIRVSPVAFQAGDQLSVLQVNIEEWNIGE